MKLLESSLWLAMEELRKKWHALIWGTLFYGYTVFMIAIMSEQFLETDAGTNIHAFTGVMANFFVLAILQNLGFPMNGKYFSFWKSDTFTKRLHYLKRLPISNEVIIMSRILQFLFTIVIMTIIFFGIYYIIMAYELISRVDIFPYLSLAVIWMGYAIITGSLNLYWELAVSGKTYFRYCLLMTLVYGVVSVIIWYLYRNSIWLVTAEWARDYGFVPAILSLILGVISLVICGKQLKKRLDRRDLHG
jgi:hypothetical protein